ncbi:MAG: aminotransferase, partial [Gammaproteobacteria bacterium]|nr:aminotransferase [Gammaproteobacteria bacterium]
ESNDLALRLAENFTGKRGVVVTEAAYHGNTSSVTDVSPTVFKRHAPSAHVRFIPAPSRQVPLERVGETFAAHVTAAIADLERSGIGFSALLVDSIFSSDGVFADPCGFLRAGVDVAHRARGLFIADEVQCGFGRTGAALWGFERHGVEPDVVTLGKPMGNGYPVGAVITRPDILEAFSSKVGYFNTFGGGPVAAAAGQAVLDVIREEGLMENARGVGEYLKSGLAAVSARHPELAEVRGAGLYVGVEVSDGAGAEGGGGVGVGVGRPVPELAKFIINGLRERRVLIGAAGRYGNVLKIRPPLCFSRANADQLIGALDDVLTLR